MKHPLSFRATLLAFILSGAFATIDAIAATAGRAQFVAGHVVVTTPDRPPRELRKGDPINEGEVIITGTAATAQLLMSDGSIMALRPESRMRIESYSYDKANSGLAQNLINLFRGGVRTISGTAKQFQHKYQVRTPTAVVGVRGTDHETYHIPPLETGKTAVGNPGTYDRVFSGNTYIETGAGTLDLGPRQIGYAADLNTQPILLSTIPDFMTQIPSGLSPSAMQKLTGGSPRSSDQSSTTADTSASPPAIADSNSVPLAVPGMKVAPAGSAIVGADLFYNPFLARFTTRSDGMVVDPSLNETAILNPENHLFAVNNGGNYFYFAFPAFPLQRESAIVDGTEVNWGLYLGGIRIDPILGADLAIFFHYANAALATTPTVMATISGTHTFGTIVGTTYPTNETLSVGGTVASFSTTIDFGTQKLTSWNIGVTDADERNWSGTFAGSVPIANGAFSTTLSTVNCSGCAAGTTSGNASVVVVGPNGGGIISSYDMHQGTASVSGTVVATKP